MSSKREVRREYDRSAFTYERRYKAIQWEKYGTMLETLEFPLEGRILDLGCGTGLLSLFLKREVYGADFSFQMLKKAKRREIVVQADMDFLPFRDAVFDSVLSFTSLQNLPSPDHIFNEVRRVLKKGHPFVFTILKKDIPFSLHEKMVDFTILEVKECGEDLGFVCQ